MRKVWVLDTETKGTGANMVPLEDVLAKPEAEPPPPKPRRRPQPPRDAERSSPREPRRPVQTRSAPPPPGHVRKKATGELGRVRAVDPRAGTITVQWLRGGHTSTVPISTITRR